MVHDSLRRPASSVKYSTTIEIGKAQRYRKDFILLDLRMAKTIIADPPVKARPSVDIDVLAALHPELMNESYVYVHCHFDNQWQEMLIRIWKTTFLVDRHSSAKGELIHAENISYAPQWTLIPDLQPFTFLLIFAGLPKSCKVFDLIEQISEPGGFHVPDIARNETDVYHVDLV